MLKQGNYLILGIGTDVGKTFFLEKLCQKFPDSLAIKPVISGFKEDDKNSDSAKILRALNLPFNQKNLDEISPWRFEKAVSPHFAGKVNYQQLLDFCRKKISQAKAENKFLFIESAGGVMTPINEEKTFLDLAIDLKIPTLLILGNYLGAISHSLTAIAMLKKSEVLIEKIILNEILPRSCFQTQFTTDFRSILCDFCKKIALILNIFWKIFCKKELKFTKICGEMSLKTGSKENSGAEIAQTITNFSGSDVITFDDFLK